MKRLKNLLICEVWLLFAIIAVMGFGFFACDGSKGIEGSGQFAGKDVLGNAYTLKVGSDASRSASKGDKFDMELKTRDGKTRKVSGTVTGVNADGTLTLEGGGETFTAVTEGDAIVSVAGADGNMAEIKFNDNSTVTPRTFDTINLRAMRWGDWENKVLDYGESWASGMSILERDFPTNISRLYAIKPGTTENHNRYSITFKGTSDTALQHVDFDVLGLTQDDRWVWLAGSHSSEFIKIDNPGLIDKTGFMYVTDNPIYGDDGSKVTGKYIGNDTGVLYHDLTAYKEIILQVVNQRNRVIHSNPSANVNYGSVSDDELNDIKATISGFSINLKDTKRDTFKGNMPDWTFGYQEDGLSISYNQAVWKLTGADVTTVKQKGTFEFILSDLDTLDGHALGFLWQSPDKNLWWQDYIELRPEDPPGVWDLHEGVIWNPQHKKVTIDLSKVIKDTQFNTASEINLILCYWGHMEGAVFKSDNISVDMLGITGANIAPPTPNVTGNLGKYIYGAMSNGISPQYNQVLWHLQDDILEKAQKTGAKLELVFTDDISSLDKDKYGFENNQYAYLQFAWQDFSAEKYWIEKEGELGVGTAYNSAIFTWGDNAPYDITGVVYDQPNKKLTITLADVMKDYSDFENTTHATLVISCYHPPNINFNEFGMVSANIVEP